MTLLVLPLESISVAFVLETEQVAPRLYFVGEKPTKNLVLAIRLAALTVIFSYILNSYLLRISITKFEVFKSVYPNALTHGPKRYYFCIEPTYQLDI